MPRKVEARKLWGQMSTSARVNSLTFKAAFLYPLFILHADDQGRMLADAKTIKGTIVPMRDEIYEREIPALLAEMEEQGLVKTYSATRGRNSITLLQLLDWWEYQEIANPRPSVYPAHLDWADRGEPSQQRDLVKSGRMSEANNRTPRTMLRHVTIQDVMDMTEFVLNYYVTQVAAAAALEVSPSTVSRWLRGIYVPEDKNLSLLVALSRKLGYVAPSE